MNQKLHLLKGIISIQQQNKTDIKTNDSHKYSTENDWNINSSSFRLPLDETIY